MSTPTPLPQDLLAAIDIGSNSFRLEIGQVLGGRYRRFDDLKETVRLGAGLDADGRLDESAVLRALACLAGFAQRLQSLHPSRVRAVATQTLREARNRNEFLERAQQALGLPIEVISGREEARLIYAGVSHLQPSNEPRLVADIGGRSTELILGQAGAALAVESFPVGSVGLSMRFFPDGHLSASAFRQAQVAAGAHFEEALATFAPSRWTHALGSSGTASAVSQVLAAAGGDGCITAQALSGLIQQCIEAGHVDRLNVAGLREDRRAVIPGGLSILYTLLTQFGIQSMWPAKGALRHGVIVELHERLQTAASARGCDARDATVKALQSRFGVDVAQAVRVGAVSRDLYQQACPDADPRAARELGWACDLHEIGMALSHHDHHRHSSYMLSHLDAPGFSQSQQRRLGLLVLAQRGGLRKVESSLGDFDWAWQVLCLRLAVICCHARTDADRLRLRLARRNGRCALLGWDACAVAVSPQTLFLLREEAQAWERVSSLRLELEF